MKRNMEVVERRGYDEMEGRTMTGVHEKGLVWSKRRD